MFIFLLQLRDALSGTTTVYLFAAFSTLVWVLWILKVAISRKYQVATKTFTGTSSVVIPVVDEPEDLFRDVLTRIHEQGPDEVIVVINGPRNPVLERICTDLGIDWTWESTPGKRNAVKVGVQRARGDVVLLVDSDTLWTPGTLVELLKPFTDASIGGATTRQRILSPERSFLTRWADWLENTRSLYSMPMQSALGQVGCLPGRTIAFRRHVLQEVMHDFMTQRFLGIFLEVSDDRTLTNLTLKAGYRTVYQHTSLVYTDAPLQLKKLYKQQLRWARGSQYNTLRMMPWMLGHAPVLAFAFACDIILPFLLFGAIGSWVYNSVTGQGKNFYQPILDQIPGWQGWLLVGFYMVLASWLSMSIRQLRHLDEKPSDILRLPLYILFSTVFLMPIRLLGFFRMAHAASWGTRANAYDASQEGAPEEDSVMPLDRQVDPGGSTRVQTRQPVTTRRALNPQAALPYLLGATFFALMAVASA